MRFPSFGFKKQKREWGTVYDAVTKQPIDPAYVTVADMLGRTIATSITDLDGRYGFVLPPGTYQITVQKTNYAFPSLKLAGKDHDAVYDDLYFGEPLTIMRSEDVISKNIPLDPVGVDWNEQEKARRRLGFFSRGTAFSRIASVLLTIGLLASLIAVIAEPAPLEVGIFVFYIMVYFIRVFTIGNDRRVARIISAKTGEPVSFALVRVFAAQSGQEITKKASSYQGTFFCLIPNGNYYVQIETRNSDGTYTPAFTSSIFTVTRGMIKKTFAI